MADSDYGVKVSQAGKDAQDAGDSELAFSSSWPLPKIVFQGRIKSYTTSDTEAILNHNLGYVPMFIPYDMGDSASIFRTTISADTKNIYYTTNSLPGPIDIGLMVFDVDIEKNYTAPNVNLGTSSATSVDKNYGIKLSKEGKDVSSTDLRDFILHSGTRSPLLHAVSSGAPNAPGSVVGTFGNYVYEHNLPYDPMFLAYVRGDIADVRGAYVLINNFSGLNTDKKTITIKNLTLSFDPRASIVIFKDPFEIDTVIGVR